jgi:hypothetical protein
MCSELFHKNLAEFSQLEKRYLKKREAEQEKHGSEIVTPIPNPKHDSCHTCGGQFKDFKMHIKSALHRERVLADNLYQEIDSVINELDQVRKK